jgi:hypothetical protein
MKAMMQAECERLCAKYCGRRNTDLRNCTILAVNGCDQVKGRAGAAPAVGRGRADRLRTATRPVPVAFARSDKEARWTPGAGGGDWLVLELQGSHASSRKEQGP